MVHILAFWPHCCIVYSVKSEDLSKTVLSRRLYIFFFTHFWNVALGPLVHFLPEMLFS